MCDVLFVIPSQHVNLHEDFQGTLLLATILKQKGVSTCIHRFYEVDLEQSFDSFVRQTVAAILEKQPKIVSFYCRCDCYLANLLIAKGLKEASPELKIVFGGPQAEASAVETLKEISWVDFCCCGEGETTVFPLFSALLNGTDHTQVLGLVYRDAVGTVCRNENAPMIEDLDTLPCIDYSFLPQDAIEYTVSNGKAASIEVGRGCPFNCAYCSSSLFWKRKFRLKSAQRIVREMQDMYEYAGVKKFVFQHDLFTVNKKKILAFTNELEKTGIDFKWACSCRVDTLDQEAIDAMARTGLRSVFIGVESGSEKMQKSMNKNLKIQDVLDTVAAMRKHDIKVKASFIYALPEETEEDLEQSLQLAYQLHKMGVSSISFHLCVIVPGTEYYHRYADNLVLSSTQSNIVGDFGFAESQEFIQEHPNLFTFSYEYESELRRKYAQLEGYVLYIFHLYDQLMEYCPEALENKTFAQLALEVMSLYEGGNGPGSVYQLAMDYTSRYLTDHEQKKLFSVFSYLDARAKAVANNQFLVDFKSYPIHIQDVIDGKPLAEIREQETMVCFKRDGNKVLSLVMPK